jgi:hypothetical protein
MHVQTLLPSDACRFLKYIDTSGFAAWLKIPDARLQCMLGLCLAWLSVVFVQVTGRCGGGASHVEQGLHRGGSYQARRLPGS